MNIPITPIYVSHRANSELHLDSSEVELTFDGRSTKGFGTAILRLAPRCLLIIRVEFPPSVGTALRIGLSGKVAFKYPGMKKFKQALVINSEASSEHTAVELLPSDGRMTLYADGRTRLTSITFHIVNFPDFHSTGPDSADFRITTTNSTSTTHHRLGRVLLTAEPWQIDIQALPVTARLVKQLRAEGGYAITHVGRLTRVDGRSFTISASETCLYELRKFLSFARGHWTATFGAVGFDAFGNDVYRDWSMTLGTPWEPRQSWFSAHHGECLGTIFPGFLKLLRSSDLGPAASRALYWFLRSNRAGEAAGIDSGIILSQASLETLAVAYLTASGHPKGHSAAELIRNACVSLRLPVALPKQMNGLYNARRKGEWTDAPEAITRVRNELVHPKNRLKVKLANILSDTWELAQWYVELLILRLSGYSGVYSNRWRARWVGEVEAVPWARKKT